MIRLQKYLAEAGIASRRKAERYITDGRITVNGTLITQLGTRIDPEVDVVKVDRKTVIRPRAPLILYALYKPRFCVTTLSDPQGRDTIVAYFPKIRDRLIPVGRLDYDAEGLILLTNSGDLAHRIAHPSQHIWKQYFVKIKGQITHNEIRRLKSGPVIDGQKRQPVRIQIIHTVNDKTWLTVWLQEGLKHHLKKMFGEIGFPVLKIKRYAIGHIELKELSPGECRRLEAKEIEALLAMTRSQKGGDHATGV